MTSSRRFQPPERAATFGGSLDRLARWRLRRPGGGTGQSRLCGPEWRAGRQRSVRRGGIPRGGSVGGKPRTTQPDSAAQLAVSRTGVDPALIMGPAARRSWPSELLVSQARKHGQEAEKDERQHRKLGTSDLRGFVSNWGGAKVRFRRRSGRCRIRRRFPASASSTPAGLITLASDQRRRITHPRAERPRALTPPFPVWESRR